MMTVRRLVLAICTAMALTGAAQPALAQTVAGSVSLPLGASEMMSLGLNKSKVIELPRNARDIMVSDPTIVIATMRDARRIFLSGIKVGQADLYVMDQAGNQILHLALRVERDNTGLQAIIARLVPTGRIRVEVVNDNIVLSGTVKNAGDLQKAQQIAEVFANGGQNVEAAQTVTSPNGAQTSAAQSKVVNLLTIEGEDQVQLKVSVVEMNRTVSRQLGIDLNLQGTVGSIVTVNPAALTGVQAIFNKSGSDFSATLTALEDEGFARTLAEPTLTAISGETANFFAGGEFPVPTDYNATENKLTYEFKKYGVSLGFTPTVLSEGRISLKVKTEVSELSDDGAITGTVVTIKSLKTRSAESTLELPSGGTLALGGLLQDNVTQSFSGTPGLKDLPILGALFRSRSFERKQTELVILVTPYMVRPTAATALARPDDGFDPPGDAEGVLLGRLNKVYGKAGAPAPKGAYGGQYGFIYD